MEAAIRNLVIEDIILDIAARPRKSRQTSNNKKAAIRVDFTAEFEVEASRKENVGQLVTEALVGGNAFDQFSLTVNPDTINIKAGIIVITKF